MGKNLAFLVYVGLEGSWGQEMQEWLADILKYGYRDHEWNHCLDLEPLDNDALMLFCRS